MYNLEKCARREGVGAGGGGGGGGGGAQKGDPQGQGWAEPELLDLGSLDEYTS